MKAKTISANTPDQLRSALEDSMRDGYRPTLALVFASVKQDREAICEVLHEKGIDILGATSSGEFSDSQQSEGEAVVMLWDLARENYALVYEAIGDRSLEEAAARLAVAARSVFDKPALILCSTLLTADGRMLDGESLIRHLEKTLGPDINMFGGMAGDDITFTGTYVFTHGWSTDYGMIALVLNEARIGMQGMAISGWKPVGISRTVTHSEGNLIFTIDDQPALDIYMRYLGQDKASAEDQVKFFDTVGVHYPFQIAREGREPKMCNPIGYDKEKEALMCESEVPQGATFRFSTPPEFDIVETVLEKAGKLKDQTHEGADALLIFSCAGRLSALGPMAQQENEGLQALWNVPMAGFYTYGEFGRGLDGKHDFHSTTNAWVALKEKTKL
jgi:hypothetical protein